MTTLYLDCAMGAAGDMIAAALLDIVPDRKKALEALASAGIPTVRYEAETIKQNGITGTHLHVYVDGEEEVVDMTGSEHDHDHDHEHHHHHGSSLKTIKEAVQSLKVSDTAKSFVGNVYDMIARAESDVHGETVERIHFHEVGAWDAVADITASAILLDMIAPDRVVVSPVTVGYGTVKCAHGILPVPAPATAKILEGMPVVTGDVRGEMCTPTGAAVLKAMACEYGPMPAMTIEKTGFGFGTKVFAERLNAVRAILGTETQKTDSGLVDIIVELQANIDDMTGEAMGFALESLYAAGAREAFVVPVTTKKSRPGYLLTVLCGRDREDEIVKVIFRTTTTIGVRRLEKDRYVLNRETYVVETEDGPVRVKKAEGYGVSRQKAEYDDVRAIALKTGKTLDEIVKALIVE